MTTTWMTVRIRTLQGRQLMRPGFAGLGRAVQKFVRLREQFPIVGAAAAFGQAALQGGNCASHGPCTGSGRRRWVAIRPRARA